MDKRETKSSDSPALSHRGSGLLIFGTIVDTTWRLFTPVIGLLLAGMWLDDKTSRNPAFALAGVVLGSIVAFLLVRLQYKQVLSQEMKHD